MFIPDNPILRKKETGNTFHPDLMPAPETNSFVADPKESTFGERLKASFGGAEAKEKIVEPKGFMEGFRQKGFLGGLGEVGSDIADVAGGTLPLIGGVLGAAGGTVAGLGVGGIAGGAIGATAGESARQAIGRFMGVRDDVSLGSEATDLALTAGLSYLGGKVGKYVVSRFPKLLGIFSGEGDDAIRAALNNPKAADIGLAQGDDAIRALVKEGSEKSIQLRTNFINSYSNAFKDLTKQYYGKLVSKNTILKEFTQMLGDNRVKLNKGVLDFAVSKIKANPGEISKINAAYEAITQWDDWTLNGVNQLKQLVGGLTKFADDAGIPSKSPFLGRFYNSLDNTIKNNLPKDAAAKYSVMNKKFSDTIDLFDDMVDAFNKGDPFTRLANSLGENKDTLRKVLEFYDSMTGTGTKAIIAGRTIGQEKNAAFGILNPRSWIDFFISPKLQGSIITRTAKISNPIAGTAKSAYDSYSRNINTGFESLMEKGGSAIRKLNFSK